MHNLKSLKCKLPFLSLKRQISRNRSSKFIYTLWITSSRICRHGFIRNAKLM
uniref:Uncharacterized protein n=1 Tax=Oryza brachyantha TaxID=4533 RepID=J3LEH4_ORYBR